MASAARSTKPRITIYTDGACSGNPGPGGWAYILRYDDTGDEVEASEGEPRTTNNRMELLGAINGLERLDEPSRVRLFSDSQYVVKGLEEWMDEWKARGWKRGRSGTVRNLELWKRLDRLRQRHDLQAEWVRGHDEHPENERCDRLAVAAAERFK